MRATWCAGLGGSAAGATCLQISIGLLEKLKATKDGKFEEYLERKASKGKQRAAQE
jgi:hypothetical protein